jgi:mono/diheme cytochrome c family protein
MRLVLGRRLAIGTATVVVVAITAGVARAQAGLSAEDARTIEFGKEIFKSKATCQFCHKWDGAGDQGYGGNALSLRKTQLTREQLTETIKCGRPGTPMPYHDQFAYTDKRCYGLTRTDLGKDMPPAAVESLQAREIDAVVKFLLAKVVGRGDATYDECIDFWGQDTRLCEALRK